MSNLLKINIQVTGDKALMEALRRTSGNMTDFRDELSTVGDFLVDFYKEKLFATDGALLGERWAPLSSGYLISKTKKFGRKGVLDRTGTMRRNYDHKAEPMTLTVANVTDYAKYHHFGTSRLPKRTLIGFSGDMQGQIINVFTKAVLVRLNK